MKNKWSKADIGEAQFLSNKYGIDYNLDPIVILISKSESTCVTNFELY